MSDAHHRTSAEPRRWTTQGHRRGEIFGRIRGPAMRPCLDRWKAISPRARSPRSTPKRRRAVPGVLAVFTHLNAPKLEESAGDKGTQMTERHSQRRTIPAERRRGSLRRPIRRARGGADIRAGATRGVVGPSQLRARRAAADHGSRPNTRRRSRRKTTGRARADQEGRRRRGAERFAAWSRSSRPTSRRPKRTTRSRCRARSRAWEGGSRS